MNGYSSEKRQGGQGEALQYLSFYPEKVNCEAVIFRGDQLLGALDENPQLTGLRNGWYERPGSVTSNTSCTSVSTTIRLAHQLLQALDIISMILYEMLLIVKRCDMH